MSENNEIPKTGIYPDMMEWLGLLAEYYPGHASGQRAQCALDTIQAQNKRVAELEAHHDGITALAKIVELQERIAELEAALVVSGINLCPECQYPLRKEAYYASGDGWAFWWKCDRPTCEQHFTDGINIPWPFGDTDYASVDEVLAAGFDIV